MLTADVFVNIPVKSIAKAYTYRVPDVLSHVGAGWRVFVPFGGRKVEGFVLSVAETDGGDIALKDILAAVDDEAWFTEEMIAAARWLSEFYLCSLAEMMRLFMPGKSGLKISVSYAPREEAREHVLLGMELCRKVYELLLEKGAMTRQAIRKALPESGDLLDGILDKLLHHRVIEKRYDAEKRASAQYEKYVILTGKVTEELLESFHRRKAQRRLLEFLREKPEQSMAELKTQKVSPAVVKALCETGLAEICQRRVLRDSYRDLGTKHSAVVLTREQEKALENIFPYMEHREYHGFLLHGVTGSGKTQVYIEAASRARDMGRTVIVLVPEIALTGQLVMAFKAYFRQDIIVMHSRLSLAERNDAILRVRRGEAGIIIGARSALFTPAENIGLIILDEEQDMSYKQDESPRYHARVVAEKLAQLHHGILILGSATPSLETFHRAKTGKLSLLSMPERIGGLSLPEVKCVDMRQEMKQGNRHIVSRALERLIGQTLAEHQQLIIMLNRRGFSTFVMCRSCGTVLKCRFCGLPLVYHKNGRLCCHHCDVQEEVPSTCPKCGSRYIKYFGSGTEKLEQELHMLAPEARVVRMDRDTTGKKFAHQEILGKFRRGEYDILLGTQMVAKGHDIPNVTAVGIISADSSLHMPDFRAAERCFMLITQTAGRAGRHSVKEPHDMEGGGTESCGHVVVQSYNPEHYAVTCGIAQDYEGFYAQEIAMRKKLFYPPFSRLVKLLFQHGEEETAREHAAGFVERFRKHFAGEEKQQVIGPSPAMISNFRGIFRFVVLIKTAVLGDVQSFLRQEGLQTRTDVAIDIDPITMM